MAPEQCCFIAVAAGEYHSLGLEADGSIVAWGHNWYGQCSMPEPNTDFVAVAGGGALSLGIKGCILGDLDGDGDVDQHDLLRLLMAYSTCDGDPDFDGTADFDDSGCIELSDLAELLGHYGAGT